MIKLLLLALAGFILYSMVSGLLRQGSSQNKMSKNRFREGEKMVGDLAKTLNIPQAVISRHLAILRHRGIVAPRREGKNIYYSITDSKIIEACDLVHELLLSQVAKNKKLAETLMT